MDDPPFGAAAPEGKGKNAKDSWSVLQQRVKDAKRFQMTQSSRIPTSFTLRSHPASTADFSVARLYFLGVPPGIGRRENTLLYVDVSRKARKEEDGLDQQTDCLAWRPLLDAESPTGSTGELSKEEQLLRERRRVTSLGVTAYDAHVESGKFAFILAGGSLATCQDSQFTSGQLTPLVAHRDAPRAAVKLDPKMCPFLPELVAYVCDGDLWVQSDKTGVATRLTFARQGGNTSSIYSSCGGITLEEPLSCGAPPFVTQEEFDRCTGYWWQPAQMYPTTIPDTDGEPPLVVCRILYEEVDESDVDVIFIPSAPASSLPVAMSSVSGCGMSLDAFRYPRAGTTNARSTLKVVQFNVDPYGQISCVVNLQLWQPLETLFPWSEYIVRAGWYPSSDRVWLQLMDRQQQRLALVLLPLDAFVTPEVVCAMSVNAVQQRTPKVHILREESSTVWVNVHDGLYFFPEDEAGVVSFLWLSECTGHQHLYLCKSSTSGDWARPGASTALTTGDWEVNGQQLWVDEKQKMVFFIGSMDSVIESHLYCVSYAAAALADSSGESSRSTTSAQQPRRLTEAGYSHAITIDTALGLVVDTFSSISSSTACHVHELCWPALPSENDAPVLARVAALLSCTDAELCRSCGRMELNSRDAPATPRLMSYVSRSGSLTHCLVYEPAGLQPGFRYPTVLFVYGGPQVQLVTNADKSFRFTRLSTMASLGYAVILMDCRGSKGRGVIYEGHIKNKMGTVEVDDQVEGLYALADQLGYLDLDRVAVHGWSYGGYLALMALAQRPDVFKVGVAGAPVTAWHLYDTGYTERYMGTPDDNEAGYQSGSVLSYVDGFPDSPGRLLIIHGLIDENVHFSHTSMLLNALVKAGKPYQLQVYPAERHGIRSPEANEHFETTVLHFLSENL